MQIIQMDSMVPNNEFLIKVSSLFLFIIYYLFELEKYGIVVWKLKTIIIGKKK